MNQLVIFYLEIHKWVEVKMISRLVLLCSGAILFVSYSFPGSVGAIHPEAPAVRLNSPSRPGKGWLRIKSKPAG
jgi:hypothetical protein